MKSSTLCGIIGHRYGSTTETHDEAPHWTCRKCGHNRYAPPTAFWSTIGIGGGGGP
jgi:hypothetical protein